MLSKKILSSAIAAAALGVSLQAVAFEPASIRVGEMLLTPTLGITEAYNDNIRETADGESSWITTLNGGLRLSAQERLNTYFVEYAFSSDVFHSSQDDNNTDHFFGAGTHLEFDSRNRLDLNARYANVTSVADTTQLGVEDETETTTIGGVYGFGAESARFQLEVGVNQEWLRYVNGGVLNEAKERDVLSGNIIGFMRLAPKTRALVEVRQREFDYEQSGSRRDSTANIYLAGLTWDATAKTSGTIKVGREEKDFDERSIKDQDTSTWEVGVSWQPRTYSTFELVTRKGFDEARFSETFIETTSSTISWKHDWSSRVSTTAAVTYIEEEFADAIKREDETWIYRAGVDYAWKRWLNVGLSYEYKDKESDLSVREYDRNLVALTLNLSF